MTTLQEILTLFYSLVGETVDETVSITLANFVKNLIESDRDWHFLIKEDSTKTYNSGENYLTQKSLPTDFASPYKMFLGDASLKDFQEYGEIPFHLRRKYNDITNRFYVDYTNKKFFLTGMVDKLYTVYLYYVYQTPEMALPTTENGIDGVDPVWQERFIPIIPFTMAQIYQSGMDNDEITARQAVSHDRNARLLFDQMVNFDAKIKTKQMGNHVNIEDNQDTFQSGRIDINS